jgi:ABC-2 type transport system permease protein
VLNWLPFRAIMDVPFRLYSGHLPAAQAPLLIGQQLLWAAILVLIGRLVLSRGLRRLVVQGG